MREWEWERVGEYGIATLRLLSPLRIIQEHPIDGNVVQKYAFFNSSFAAASSGETRHLTVVV
ncbi:MAG: hypothetical protein ACMG55_00905 [Microcoleus sp.]